MPHSKVQRALQSHGSLAVEHGVICLQQHGDSMLPGHIVASGALHEALWSVNKVTSFVHSAEPIDSL